MYLARDLRTVCTILGATAFFSLSSGLTASPLYTYTYSGPAFTFFDNNSTTLAPITNGNVDVTLTLDDPILSDGMLTNYTPDVTNYSITDGNVVLDPANSTVDAYFGTTNGAITDWTITATANGLQPGEQYYQIDSETNTGLLYPSLPPFYSDISLNVDDSGNFSQGKAGALGPNPSPFVQLTPEPSTETMMFLGLLPLAIVAIVKLRKREIA